MQNPLFLPQFENSIDLIFRLCSWVDERFTAEWLPDSSGSLRYEGYSG